MIPTLKNNLKFDFLLKGPYELGHVHTDNNLR